MRIAKVLIPESARPDVTAPLVDGGPPPESVYGSGCKEGKEGGDKTKEIGKDGDKVRPEFDPAELLRAREYFGL
jgi:hypothetical protein